MTLEEIIKKENGIIKNEQFFQDTHIVFTDDTGEDVTIEMLCCDDTECIEESLEKSRKKLEYHKQLVDCIKELATFRKQAKKAKELLKELKEYKDKFGDISEIDTSLYYDGFKDGYKSLYKEFKDSFEEINGLMVQYFEMWNTKVELTELEKLGLHIITIGMQDLGAFIDKGKDTSEVSF